MDIKEVILTITKKQQFHQVGYEEFAPEGCWAHTVAQSLQGTKMRQLRKVFNPIKNIDKKIKAKGETESLNEPVIFYIIPQVAYARGRNLVSDEFYQLLKVIIGRDAGSTKLKTVADYRRFTEFMTAVMAYSK